MSRRLTVFVTLLLAFALGTSGLAGCMDAADAMPQAQMACCAKGHDQCPMHRSTSERATDCCQHNSQRQRELAAAEQPSVHALAVSFAHFAMIVSPAGVPDVRFAPASTYYSSHPNSPPAPRTALSTVLLI